uniref:Dual specificity protein phosphatase 10 n=1 Tax=Petromyzon marinus TaxID=7757 RepID=A0AAJ7SRR7_PETMA|nr:dual specificity protein phosphatase 10 [Petromyzon marinus]
MPPSPLEARLTLGLTRPVRPQDLALSVCLERSLSAPQPPLQQQRSPVEGDPGSASLAMPATGGRSAGGGGPVRSLSCGCSSSSCCSAVLSYEERGAGAGDSACSSSSTAGGAGADSQSALRAQLLQPAGSADSVYPGPTGGLQQLTACAPCGHLLQLGKSGLHRSHQQQQRTGSPDPTCRTIWPNELARRLSRASKHRDLHLHHHPHHHHMHHHPSSWERDTAGAAGPLIIDCRPFLDYNRCHVQGALHVHCTDKMSRRRLQQGKVSVVELASCREGKEALRRQLSTREVVIYDENTTDLGRMPSSSPLCLVIESLRKEGREPIVLKGGLSSFRQQHENLCTSSLHVPSFPSSLHSNFPSSQGLQMQTLSFGFGGQGMGGSDASTPDVENAEMTAVLPFLFLGNEQDAQDLAQLQRLNIGYIINVTSHLPLYHYERGALRYKRLPATDSCKQNLRQYFEEAFEFIEEAYQSGKGLLIHCQAGVSRSATIVIAYLMKHTRMTMTDAYKFVKGKRPIISPNLNFMGQLLQFEEDLNSGVSPRILSHRLVGLETVV